MNTIDMFKKELEQLMQDLERCKDTRIKKQILHDFRLLNRAIQELSNSTERYCS
ncbi:MULTISPECIES: hypothetical protein [Cytobacillus]|uniref:hypothetical protein n=1 Tax=Cytobacillus TaxID=2675230 RepID=UPI00203EAFDF|nr:hypothetical protein [Cytobacillus firmus]MCM3704353.1 hypothetical protein [Cytobacillus firmus]